MKRSADILVCGLQELSSSSYNGAIGSSPSSPATLEAGVGSLRLQEHGHGRNASL